MLRSSHTIGGQILAKTSKKNLHDAEENPPQQQSLGVEPENLPLIEEPTAPEPQSEPEAPEGEEPPPAVAETEPQKRRPGRPSRTDPPVLRSAIIERINNLKSWDGTRVYCYRWEPYTDRKAGGKQSVMVKRYDGPFDEQDVLEDPGLGSGVYEFVVNRTNPETRQRSIIDSGVVRLLNMKYPPKIPQKEWVDDERNKDWEWARNLCDKPEAPGSVPIAPTVDPLVTLMQSTITAQQQELREMRQEFRTATATKKDPGEATLLTVLAPVIPVLLQRLLEPPKADPTQALFMQYLMNQADKKQDAPAVKDPTEELTRIVDLKNKMEESFGGGNGARSRKSGWQEVISEVAGPVAEVLKPFSQLIAMGMAQQAAAARAQQTAPQPAQQPPPTQPPATQPPTAPQAQQSRPHIVKPASPTIEAFTQAVVDHLSKGFDGYQLGDWYLEQFGDEEFTQIRMEGKSRLVKDLQSNQTAWKQLEPYAQNGTLDKMLGEFITWEASPDDEDEEGEDEPEPIAATAAPIQNGWTEEVRS